MVRLDNYLIDVKILSRELLLSYLSDIFNYEIKGHLWRNTIIVLVQAVW